METSALTLSTKPCDHPMDAPHMQNRQTGTQESNETLACYCNLNSITGPQFPHLSRPPPPTQ